MRPRRRAARAISATTASTAIGALALILGGCSAAAAVSPEATSSASSIPPATSAGSTDPRANASPGAATPAPMPSPPSTTPTPTPEPSIRVPASAYLRDATSRATFGVVVDRGDPTYGLVSLGIPKVGLVWTTVPVKLARQADRSIKVSYDGPGELDGAAMLDLEFGVLAQRSGASRTVEISLRGSIGAKHRTGTVTVTVAGQRHVIVDGVPTESAQATLAAFLTATRKEDWRQWYELFSSTATRSFSADEWVAMIERGLAPYGRVIAADAGTITYNSDAYLDLASAPFSITVEKNGASRILEYTVTLVWEKGGWRVATTSAPPPP